MSDAPPDPLMVRPSNHVPPRPWASTWRWGVVVVLAFAAIHGPFLARKYEPNSWLFADGAFYFTTLRAITEHGRLEQKELQPTSWYERDLGWNGRLTDDWSNVALGREGRWYPKHPILVPLASLPLYLLMGTPGTFATNVLMNLVFVLLCFLLARRVAPLPVAAIAAIATAHVGFVQEMSYSFSNDVLGTVVLLGALEATLAGLHGFAGILAGLSLWSRLTNGAFLPALIVVGYAAGGWRAVLRSALFAGLPLGSYALLNTWMFGAPWVTPYQSVLVRENGVAVTASHARLFTVPMLDGLKRLVFGHDGGFKTFWPLAPGLAGTLPLLFAKQEPRGVRRAFGLSLLLATAFGFLAFAKYSWYRPHFLYPIYGLSTVGFAALLAWPLRRGETLERREFKPPRWVWATAAIVVLGGSLGVRALNRRDPALLSTYIHEARVSLDGVPCDYWNPQNERWECAHYDRGGWSMTGRIIGEPARVKGESRRGLWLHPSASRKWRRVVFESLPAKGISLDFALGDASRPGLVEVEVLTRGSLVAAFTLDGAGQSNTLDVAFGEGPGAALELRYRSDAPDWKHLVAEGRLHPE